MDEPAVEDGRLGGDSGRAEQRGAGTEATPSVRVDGLTKMYDEVRAVDDVSLDVRPGEFLVLVGPSGCGKTTVLRTIAGLESPSDGQIRIEGEDVTGLDPRERDVSMVFQNYALYPHKRVRENLAFPLQIRNFPADEIESRVSETASVLDITDLLDRKPGQLSGGQQQRVALGRAIVREPAVFLMDEPLSNLDAKLRTRMRTELNELHKRVGRTTVYVTHDQAEAMTLGDRVAVMNGGRLQQVGPPLDLYADPTNRFVAGFVGDPSMNFFESELVADGGDYRVRSPRFSFALPDSHRAALEGRVEPPAPVTFGVRPEDVYDARAADSAASSDAFEARVKLVEPLGRETEVTFAAGERSDEEFIAIFDRDTPVEEDETVQLAVDLDRTHVFDRATGENLTATPK